jgi:GTP cyclohydrolase IA
MPNKYILGLAETEELARRAAKAIMPRTDRAPRVYAIPRGGITAAMFMRASRHFELVDHPARADYIVDDLIDSGDTMKRTLAAAPDYAVPVVLIDKTDPASLYSDKWIVFPWESDASGRDEGLEANVKRMLQYIGEDADRGGLLETPARVAKAWEFWASGYKVDPAELLKTFEDGADNVNEMVMVRNIPFYTHCEHHMAPFFGRATIAYIPDGRIVGLSKLSRVLDAFSRRLQVQERLTTQVADALWTHLKPKGVGVTITARHLCMESRGVCQQGHDTVTNALRGVMLEGTPRAEFLALSRN